MSPLRDVLEELALEAPRPAPQPRLWDQGRRLRRRDTLVRAGLALVLVVLVGGLSALVLGPPPVVSPADDVVPEGALPSRIVDVPPWVTGAGSRDLAVGRASVAFISSGAHTVLVSATDGSYRRVELPDRRGARTMVLSPDGTHLAYVFTARPDETPDPVAGVAVVDLLSGEVERVPAVDGDGTSVDIASLGWSPDGRWLAWAGQDGAGRGETGPVPDSSGTAGVVEVDTMEQSTIGGLAGAAGAVGVSDDGVATVVSGDMVLTYHPVAGGAEEEPLRSPTGGPGGVQVSDRAVTSSDGSLTAVGRLLTGRSATFVSEDGDVLPRRLAADLYPAGGRVTPLGWAAPSLLMAVVEPVPGSVAYGGDAASLVLMTSPDRPESEWTYRYLVRDLPDIAEVSVAVDLVPDLDGTSAQQLTREFAEPDWPMPAAVRALLVGGAALGLLLAAYLLWRRTRRLG